MRLPGLHPQRADVLAAVALVVRQRQPLAVGLDRLTAGDPLLRPWHERLGPDLAAGRPLGAVLHRHRLVDTAAARQLDAAPDPVAAMDRLAREQLRPVRGLWLVRWYPAVLVGVMLIPFAVMQASGVGKAFSTIFRDLNIQLPALTVAILDPLPWGPLVPIVGAAVVGAGLNILAGLRGLRHLPQLWWVEVHRQAALLELIDAALAGADTPRRLRWPWSWLATLRVSAWRQNRPAWDRNWRTWRILTRLRALGPGWRAAAKATTATGVLQAVGLLPAAADRSTLEALRSATRERLVLALAVAQSEANAIVMVGFAAGLLVAALALFLPLIKITESLSGGG